MTLFTDVPVTTEIEELPGVFDLAVPSWCEFFSIDPAQAVDWHLTGYLMDDRDLFQRLGVLREGLPRFLHGYQSGNEIWCDEQRSDYYRRHLLLHEGTHGFMHHFLRGAGPPWYMEGTAELLATHRWKSGVLDLKWMPASREEAPLWGRIKAVRDELTNGRAMSLDQILRYDSRAHLQVEPYAWCWAAATFLEHHPTTRQPFHELRQRAEDRSDLFSAEFRTKLGADWPFLGHAWQAFVNDLTYGYDLAAGSFIRKPARLLDPSGITQPVQAARGWQSTGVLLEADRVYQLEAQGRYQIETEPRIWWCEPDGVTIRYYKGFPLGRLLAAVVDETVLLQRSPLTDPISIGSRAELVPAVAGVLFLRVNDHPAELSDNDGELMVTIRAIE